MSPRRPTTPSLTACPCACVGGSLTEALRPSTAVLRKGQWPAVLNPPLVLPLSSTLLTDQNSENGLPRGGIWTHAAPTQAREGSTNELATVDATQGLLPGVRSSTSARG